MTWEKDLNKRFERKIKLRMVISLILVVFGMVSLGVSLYGAAMGMAGSDRIKGFYSGMGGGLIGAGTITFFRNLILLKNEEKRKIRQLVEYDERNRYLRSSTMTYSGYLMIGILYLGTVFAAFFNESLAVTLLTILGIYMAVIFMINIMLQKFF